MHHRFPASCALTPWRGINIKSWVSWGTYGGETSDENIRAVLSDSFGVVTYYELRGLVEANYLQSVIQLLGVKLMADEEHASEKQSKFTSLTAKLSVAENQALTLRSEGEEALRAADVRLESVYSSRCWLSTAPLRWIDKVLHRVITKK